MGSCDTWFSIVSERPRERALETRALLLLFSLFVNMAGVVRI